MAYEFKKLGDVEALEEVPENANALIEVDGAIKRVPGSNLGGVLIVQVTQKDDEDSRYVLNVSRQELSSAIGSGKPVLLYVRYTDGEICYAKYLLADGTFRVGNSSFYFIGDYDVQPNDA